MDTPLPFWEKTRGARYFAELFWSNNWETMCAVAIFNVRDFPVLSRGGTMLELYWNISLCNVCEYLARMQ